MGSDPLTPNTPNGCNPFLDTDQDRLNDCEERLLGTEACVGDTDGDGVPDLVEVLSGTNPLVPEDLLDTDRDGYTNMDEVLAHTDPLSADSAFRVDRGYDYVVTPTDPDNGRACYNVRISNVGLVQTQSVPNPPFADTPAGNNDIYIYFQAGRENDPRGAGIGSLEVQSLRLLSPSQREPEGTLPLDTKDFLLGL